MHWLAGELQKIHELKVQYEEHKQSQSVGVEEVAPISAAHKASRDAFFKALHTLVDEISQRPGVIACFIANEGLLIHSSGGTEELEGLAAMAQLAVSSGGKVCDTLNLGPLHQTLIVGSTQKVVMFSLGAVELGFLALTNTNLTKILS